MRLFEIHIGTSVNLESGSKEPDQVIIIDEKQFGVIETFAHTRKDKDLNTLYKLNDCEFRLYPHLTFNKEND